MGSYARFGAMIATSTVVMFGLMYLNTYALDHVFWSETRAWMALLMGASMAIVMLAYMLGMYSNRRANVAIFAGAAVAFTAALWLVRSQATVTGTEYMRAMIPHHSIAVMTSERAQIVDPRVRKLADEIIAAQRREIAEMKYLVHAIDRDGPQSQDAGTGPEVPPELVSAREALAQPDIAKVDLEEMDRAEVAKALGDVPYCAFSYSRHAGPVFAATVNGDTGVAKVHGRLIALETMHDADAPDALESMRSDPLALRVHARDGATRARAQRSSIEADALLTLDEGLRVGYGGFYRCHDRGALATDADTGA